MLTTNNIKTTKDAMPGNEKLLLELEARLQTGIPAELRKLLIAYDSVEFEKKLFVRVVDNSFSQKMTLERIIGIASMLKTVEDMDESPEIRNNHLLLFGETLGSPMICIGVGKENYGVIYVFDYDFGVTEVAPSFTAFIESLK